MHFQSASFISWQAAEQAASAAEKKLFAKVLSFDASDLPSREEVEQVRQLRETSNLRLQQMLDEMRQLAAMLKTTRTRAAHPARDESFFIRTSGSGVEH